MNIKPNLTLLVMLLLLTSCGGGGNGGDVTQAKPTDPNKGAVSGSPVTPLNLSAVGENARILITWTAVPDADSYTLAWSDTAGQTQNGTTTAVASGASFVHEFVADGKQRLTTGTVYYYSISANNKNGSSKMSSEISGQLKKKPWLMPLLNSVMGN